MAIFSKLQKKHPQDFKLLVNRSTVVAVNKIKKNLHMHFTCIA
jgi:hypothetical protein